MPEKVSVLLPIPIDQKNSSLIAMTRQGIETQSYPTTLTEIIEIQYVSTAPGAHAAALNAAKEAATGTYLAHTAPGVQWDTSKLERQVYHLESQAEPTGCAHFLTIQSETGPTQKYTCTNITNYGTQIGSLLSSPYAPGTTMLTKEASNQLGSYRNINDTLWEYALRQIARKTPPAILDEDLAIWRPVTQTVKNKLVASGSIQRFLKPYIDKTETTALFSNHTLTSPLHGHLVRNALYQKNDDLNDAHQICQDIDPQKLSAETSYWHGIIHRREPDFKNARSWFSRTQHLTANTDLYQAIYGLLQRAIQLPEYGDARETALQFLRHLQTHGTWDVLYFLDLCETCHNTPDASLQKLLVDIQDIEFHTLFHWTFQKAIAPQ